MVDRSELQNKARLVESHRQHLEELQRRMDQITSVINEHQITEEILTRLTTMSKSGNAKAHVSIGAGVTLNFQHNGEAEGTAIVDLGAGIFGERKWSDIVELLATRREEFNDLHETLLKQAGAIEEKLGKLAQEFNEAAEKLQSENTPQASQEAPALSPKTPTKNTESNAKPKTRRRGGMFGNELTLDD